MVYFSHLSEEIQIHVLSYLIEPIYHLRKWIPINKLTHKNIYQNPRAIDWLLKNRNIEISDEICKNPNGLQFLLKYHSIEKDPPEKQFTYLYRQYKTPYFVLLLLHSPYLKILEKNIQLLKREHWILLSSTKKAIPFLKNHTEHIHWQKLCSLETSSIIPLLEKNIQFLDGYCWRAISGNPFLFSFLIKYPHKISWDFLSKNEKAMNLLKENESKINWYYFAMNPYSIPYFEKKIKQSVEINKLLIDDILLQSMIKYNSNAYILIERYLDNWDNVKIDYLLSCCSENNANVPFIRKKVDTLEEISWMESDIFWFHLSKHKDAIDILEEFPEKIVWEEFCCNEAIFEMNENINKENIELHRKCFLEYEYVEYGDKLNKKRRGRKKKKEVKILQFFGKSSNILM